MVFSGGSWGASGKRRLAIAFFALLAALFASALLSDPAWAQNLSIDKQVNRSQAERGQTLVYTVTVTNGTGATIPAEFEDTLPAGVRFVGFTNQSSGVACSNPSGGEFLCQLTGGLTSGQSATVQFEVDAIRTGTQTNQVEVFSRSSDTSPDDTDTATTRVTDQRNRNQGKNKGKGKNRGRDGSFFRQYQQYQEEQYLEAEEDLVSLDEETDGEDTFGDDFDDEDSDDEDSDDDSPVSATSGDGEAEASTPGAVARSGGDPDELRPLRSTPDNVVNEVPTSGPLPNTGGMSVLAVILPITGFLLLCVSIIHRIKRNR